MMCITRKLRRFASTLGQMVAPSVIIIIGVLGFGTSAVVHAASGDGPVAGAIVDRFDTLYGPINVNSPVIITTACLQGNPFVPSQPPSSLAGMPTLSGCKLDIPGGSTNLADTAQLITVLPSNFTDSASIYTFGTGSTTALEFNVTVDALSKDIFLGLANPGLFQSPFEPDPTSSVDSTADAFCTSVNGRFVCAKVEPGSADATTGCPSNTDRLLDVRSNASFCSSLTGFLQNAYNLQRNPLAYAISTNMSRLAQAGSVTLTLCPGFRAQCLSPAASPVASNVRVTTMHTQAAFVETPRLRLPYY